MTVIQLPYLGKPGAMRVLPSPNSPITATPSRGDIVKQLLSGGVAVIGNLHAKKTYSLPYQYLPAADAAVLLGFYQRLYGLGPFAFVDPTVTNVLGLDVSTCGMRSSASPGWVASSGAVAAASTGGPTGLDTGVLTWSSLAANGTLQPGSVANVANITAAPVYLPTEAVTVALWLKASAAATVNLQLAGYDAAGVNNSATLTTPLSVTTSWQQVSVTAAAGASDLASSVFVLPRVKLGASVPTTLSIAAGLLSYRDAVPAFTPGSGSPRVLPTSSPGREVQQTADFPTNHTLTLGEV